MARRKKAKPEPPMNNVGYPDDYEPSRDVGEGSWVMVKCTVPVEESVRPKVYGIYWAVPERDPGNRQKVKIWTPDEVCLLNYEYIVVSDEMLEIFKDGGYSLVELGDTPRSIASLELLEQGRNLCEEEREIIWAYQLDGLTEQQACEEYFFSRHTDESNKGLAYMPNKNALAMMVWYFGEDGVAC